MNFTHMVKNKYNGSILLIGFLDECRKEASALNAQYQTGDFIVVDYEPWEKRNA